MCAWFISSMCFPLLDCSLELLNKAIGPSFTNRISSPSIYLSLVAACNTSKIKLRDFLTNY